MIKKTGGAYKYLSSEMCVPPLTLPLSLYHYPLGSSKAVVNSDYLKHYGSQSARELGDDPLFNDWWKCTVLHLRGLQVADWCDRLEQFVSQCKYPLHLGSVNGSTQLYSFGACLYDQRR